MSDNDPSTEQTPVTPAPPLEPEQAPAPPNSIDGVKAPASKIPDKTAIPPPAENKASTPDFHSLNKQKSNGVSLAIIATVIIVIVIAALIVFAYTKSK